MKRELIEKVVEQAAEMNIISLEDCTLTKEERKDEIVGVIKECIEKENKKVVEDLVNGFSEFIFEAAAYTRLDDSTGEQRPLTLEEMAVIIYSEFWDFQGKIHEIINE